MQILFIDTESFQTRTRQALIEERLGCRTDVASTLTDLHLKFKPGTYDLVIIDHTIENGQACFDHVIAEAPGQPLLVVSNAVKCVFRRCADCVEHHNVRRLNNPTPIPNILRMVTDFKSYDCDHYDAETDRLSE